MILLQTNYFLDGEEALNWQIEKNESSFSVYPVHARKAGWKERCPGH
jgi:hypothetical protein